MNTLFRSVLCRYRTLILSFLGGLLLASCAPQPRPVTQEQALRRIPQSRWPDFENDLDMDSLRNSLVQSLRYLERVPPDTRFRFGPDTYSVDHMKRSHRLLLDVLEEGGGFEAVKLMLREWFVVYQAVGVRGDGSVLFTGYYEPVLSVRRKPIGDYRVPIYFRPPDLVSEPLELASGRTFSAARRVGLKRVPYYSREEIARGALAGKGLEIAFARNRLDVFLLQVQGSGTLRFPDGTRLRIGYAGTNGHPYRSIGKVLIQEGRIPKEEMSVFAIREFFRTHPGELDRILNLNASYVFFRVLDGGPVGSLGVPLTPGRSLATDPNLFPKGALAYVQTRKPLLGPGYTPVEWRAFGRFVLNQDSGGAIQGPGRADLFWGSGPYAEAAASCLRHPGSLYFLVMKPPEDLEARAFAGGVVSR